MPVYYKYQTIKNETFLIAFAILNQQFSISNFPIRFSFRFQETKLVLAGDAPLSNLQSQILYLKFPIRSAKKLQKVTLISGQLSAFILPHSLERDEIPTRCWERLQQSFLSREASRRGKSAGFGAAIDRSLHRAERRAESPQTCGWVGDHSFLFVSAERVPSFSDPIRQSTINNPQF